MTIEKSHSKSAPDANALPDNVVYVEFGKAADEPYTALATAREMMELGQSAKEGARLAFNFINKHEDDESFNEWMALANSASSAMTTIEVATYFDKYCIEIIASGLLSDPYLFDDCQAEHIICAHQLFKMAKNVHEVGELQRRAFFS